MSYELLTYQDAVDTCVDYMDGVSRGAPQQMIRRAICSALRAMVAVSDCDYRTSRGRIHLVASESTGTVTYVNSTRKLTLTHATATWPTWAADASIKISNSVSDILTRDSDTVVTLDRVRNPGADISTGTAFRLYKTCYHLPSDFNATSGFLGETAGDLGMPISLPEYFRLERQDNCSASAPAYYAIGGVQDLYGTLGVYVWPDPSTAKTYDYLYERQPRSLFYTGHDSGDSAGTIVTNETTAVVGTSTSFASAMVGSIIRISSSSTLPTGRYGKNPFIEERVVSTVTDTTHLTLDQVSAASWSGVKCVITDPIDLDKTFWDAFLARCTYDLACLCNLESKGDAERVYREQKHLALCASKRIVEQPVDGVSSFPRRFTVPS